MTRRAWTERSIPTHVRSSLLVASHPCLLGVQLFRIKVLFSQQRFVQDIMAATPFFTAPVIFTSVGVRIG